MILVLGPKSELVKALQIFKMVFNRIDLKSLKIFHTNWLEVSAMHFQSLNQSMIEEFYIHKSNHIHIDK